MHCLTGQHVAAEIESSEVGELPKTLRDLAWNQQTATDYKTVFISMIEFVSWLRIVLVQGL